MLVNRVWLNHFGRGLVNTPGDFGALGEKPTHPELLDWLARDFVAGGWKLKRLHKLIMTSTAYRQSSARDAAQARASIPRTGSTGGCRVRRLDAEALRDRILATSGVLNPQDVWPAGAGGGRHRGPGGRRGRRAGRQPSRPPGHEAFRRSIYMQVRRSQPLAMLHVFDQPVMETNCERRTVSTVATQSLMLMNSDFILQQAGYFAARIRKEAAGDPDAASADGLATGVCPRARAARAGTGLGISGRADRSRAAPQRPPPRPAPCRLGRRRAGAADPPVDALANLCQILLSTNEFLYVE